MLIHHEKAIIYYYTVHTSSLIKFKMVDGFSLCTLHMIGALQNHLQLHYCFHTPLRNLRQTVHSKLLINLCFALVGLYVTFIISTVSTGVPVLCGVVSALMHYFFLTVFFWMAAEAIHLHRKLVSVLKPNIKRYVLIAMAICWGRLVHLDRQFK